MFESLSDKLKRTLKNLRGEGVLTKEHVDAALREIRLALLEADVNYKVAKDFIASVQQKAEGQQVWQELKPSEQVVKIVFDELVELLGGQSSRLVFTKQIPNAVMVVGLQGSGKTTSTGKIARWLAANQDRKPLLLSVDVYRPAAREQLKVIAKATGQQIFEDPQTNDPLTLVRGALKHAQQTGFDSRSVFVACGPRCAQRTRSRHRPNARAAGARRRCSPRAHTQRARCARPPRSARHPLPSTRAPD